MIENIISFIDDNTLDEKRSRYRKNILLLFKYYIEYKNNDLEINEVLIKDIKNKFNKEVWFLSGVLYQNEHNFIKKNIFEYKNINKNNFLIKFRITIDEAVKITEHFKLMNNLNEFFLYEPTIADFNEAITKLSKFNFCKNERAKDNLDYVIINGEKYIAKCLAQIAYATANDVTDDYLHPYVYTAYTLRDQIYKKLDIEYISRKKETNMSDVIDNAELKKRLISFFSSAKRAKDSGSTKGITTKDIANQKTYYNNLKVDVSFGMGTVTTIPWMTFLQSSYTTSHGVYPYIGADVDDNRIVSHIGYSEKTEVKLNDNINEEIENINKNKLELVIDDFHNIKDDDINDIVEFIDELTKKFIQIFESNNTEREDELNMKQDQPLNQILYGPPGTGKTYKTINKALEIIFNIDNSKTLEEIEVKLIEESERVIKEKNIILDNADNNREKLKKVFEYYKEEGQIEFVTFHQSYGYEEFIEGIKAIPKGEAGNKNGTEMIYKIVPGIFKNLCELSQSNSFASKLKKFVDSLPIYTDSSLVEDGKKLINLNKLTFHIFKSKDSSSITIIPNAGEQQPLTSSQEKLIGIDNGKRGCSYDSYEPTIIEEVHKHLLNLNYVLIIDEINRGNISKIFGELITLIEPSKRIGTDEEIRVKLPYSGDTGKSFGVPSNIYILGTMNTADRSIAPIDTALRRRFVFEEMNPDITKLTNNCDGVNLQELLKAINTRIEYLYDRDHTIGHAYLLDVNTLSDLKFAFKNKIIPLLSEYFYEDWKNIDLVFNQNEFIKIKKENNEYLTLVNKEISGKEIYTISEESTWNIENFKKIYDDKIDLTKKEESSIKENIETNG